MIFICENEIIMASHYLFYEKAEDFYTQLEQHDPILVRKMVKCILHAIRTKKEETDIFEVTYRDSSTENVIVNKKNFHQVLTRCMEHLIKTDEDYLLCAKVRDAIKKLK